jgi:hypothetical protein
MAIPKFMSKTGFMNLVTSGIAYPKNVFLHDVKPNVQENFLRCYFMVDFPIAKSNIMLTLTISPEEHTQESAIRLIKEKLQQCADIEYEEAKPIMEAGERSRQQVERLNPRKLVVSAN